MLRAAALSLGGIAHGPVGSSVWGVRQMAIFNRSAAIKYAYKFALGYSREYPVFSYRGGDCTNFVFSGHVSQVDGPLYMVQDWAITEFGGRARTLAHQTT